MAKVPTALGQPAPANKATKGVAPVILQAQTDSYVVLQTPEELAQWQADLKNFHGISMDASKLAGIAAECCCGGCSDMCDMIA